MNSASNRAPVLTLEFSDAPSEPAGAAGSGSGPHVPVVFTAAEGTPAALRVASGLAQKLGVRIGLIVTEVVPFCFPLDKPPVSVDFLERRPLAPVSESDIDAEEVSIKIYLCRDRREYLRLSLKPRSLVVIAGRGRWWFRQARKVERLPQRLGHEVVFADVNAQYSAGVDIKTAAHQGSCRDSPLDYRILRLFL